MWRRCLALFTLYTPVLLSDSVQVRDSIRYSTVPGQSHSAQMSACHYQVELNFRIRYEMAIFSSMMQWCNIYEFYPSFQEGRPPRGDGFSFDSAHYCGEVSFTYGASSMKKRRLSKKDIWSCREACAGRRTPKFRLSTPMVPSGS